MEYSDIDAAHVERIMNTTNFYEILQIPYNASTDEVKSAHKKLALLVHPDKNNHPKAKEAFVAVRKSAAVLLDKEKRNEYDNYLKSPTGIGKEKFDLSEETVEAILVTAGIVGVVGIAAGIYAVYNLFFGTKKRDRYER